MKFFIKPLAIVALSTSMVAPAFASVTERIENIGAKNGHITVEIDGDTLTLRGFVPDEHTSWLAEQAAREEGFEVQNHLNHSAR